jgi:hypothetical membrane protein
MFLRHEHPLTSSKAASNWWEIETNALADLSPAQLTAYGNILNSRYVGMPPLIGITGVTKPLTLPTHCEFKKKAQRLSITAPNWSIA